MGKTFRAWGLVALAILSACSSNRDEAERGPASGGDEAFFVGDPDSALKIRWDMIQDEGEEIFADFHIWDTNGIGGYSLAKLCRKARDGVKVRLIVDGFTARPWANGVIDGALLRVLGESCGSKLQIRVWNPVDFNNLAAYFKAQNLRRSHDKILYARSQRMVYEGDRNWQNVNYRRHERKNGYTYLSLDVVVRGDVSDDVADYLESVWVIAKPLTPKLVRRRDKERVSIGGGARGITIRDPLDRHEYFIEDYEKAQKEFHEKLTTLAQMEAAVEAAAIRSAKSWRASMSAVGRVEFLHFSPEARLRGEPDAQFNHRLIELMASADKSLVVATPFVRLPEAYFTVLADRARELGGNVAFVTGDEGSSLKPQFFRLENRDVKRLRDVGVNVTKNAGADPLHLKAIVVDRRRAYLGTHNFNMRSEYTDLESGFIFNHPDAARFIESFIRSNTADELYQLKTPWSHYLLAPIVVPLLSIPYIARQI